MKTEELRKLPAYKAAVAHLDRPRPGHYFSLWGAALDDAEHLCTLHEPTIGFIMNGDGWTLSVQLKFIPRAVFPDILLTATCTRSYPASGVSITRSAQEEFINADKRADLFFTRDDVRSFIASMF